VTEPGWKHQRADAAGATTLVLCATLVLGLAGNMTFQALIPGFIADWGLSNKQAGWISGIGYLSYALVAPLAVAITDRVDARRVVVLGCIVSAAAGLGFATTAEGFWSALAWRTLAGVGIAGTYMPGLKALTDRIEGPRQGRTQAVYTAVYSVGTALSMGLAGLLADLAGWRLAFIASGMLPAMAGLVALAGLAPGAPPGHRGHALLDFRPVLAQRRAMAYILGYAGHCWELFGFRTWIVAFLGWAALRSGAGTGPGLVALIATGLLLIGLPASIFGNELAMRFGRARTVGIMMAGSALVACLIGISATLPFPLTIAVAAVYATFVMVDSAALTVGTIGSARPELRGSTIAVQTFLGSIGALLCPLAAGVVLDLLGDQTTLGWSTAFFVIGAGALLGPLSLALLAGERPQPRTGSASPP
jgi:MFS family permease